MAKHCIKHSISKTYAHETFLEEKYHVGALTLQEVQANINSQKVSKMLKKANDVIVTKGIENQRGILEDHTIIVEKEIAMIEEEEENLKQGEEIERRLIEKQIMREENFTREATL